MLVFEMTLKIKFCSETEYISASEILGSCIDKALSQSEEFLEFHSANKFKMYTFDLPSPIEKTGVYLPEKTYTFRLRTVDAKLADYFMKNLPFCGTDDVRIFTANIRIIPEKVIDKLFNLTPLVVKTENGYRRDSINEKDFEDRLKINLIKKYNSFTGRKIDEGFQFIQMLKIKNKVPVKTRYKGISVLGDKIELVPARNKSAQELAYFSLGVGIGDMCPRGMGFMGYRYL